MSRNHTTDPIGDAKMLWGCFLCLAPWILIAEWFGSNGVEVVIWLVILAYPIAFVGVGTLLLGVKIHDWITGKNSF